MNEITFSEEEQRRVDAFLSRLDKAIEAVAEAENISEYDCNILAKDVVYGQNGKVFDPRRRIRFAKSRTNRYSDLIIGGFFCSEAFPVYGPDEEERLMRSVVREVIAAGDLSMMGGLLTYLSNHKDECQVNGMICDLRSAMNERLNLDGGKRHKVTPEQFRAALIELLEMRDKDGKWRFFRKTHWVAVMRVAVDEKLVYDNRFSDFESMLVKMHLGKLRVPLVLNSLLNAYNGIYAKPLSEWSSDKYVKERGESARVVFYKEMEFLAKTLSAMLNNDKKE